MTDILAPGWLTVTEAAALTGYSKIHMQRLARLGQVTARKIGRQWVIDRESLLSWKAAARPGRKPRRVYESTVAVSGPKRKRHD
jgi:excisionase family DNA binding protein